MSLNHALLHSRPRYPGLVNSNLGSYCLDFSGNTYIDTGYSTYNAVFTITGYIRCGAQSKASPTIMARRYYYAGDTSQFPWSLVLQPGGLRLEGNADSGGDWVPNITLVSDEFDFTTWRFISMRWSGTQLSLFVDNNKKTFDSTFSLSNPGLNILIGKSYDYGGGYGQSWWTGRMSDIRYYNVVKSDSEIEAIRNGAEDKDGAIFIYSLSQSTGTSALDSSGNNLNGTISNGAWVKYNSDYP